MSSQRFLTLGAAMIAVIAMAAGWFFGVSPQLEQASAATSELQTVVQQNAAQEARLAGLKSQFATIDTLTAELADLQAEVTPVNDLSEFLSEVAVLAGESGAVLQKYTAEAPVQAVSLQADTAPAAVPATETAGAEPVTAEDTSADAQSSDTTGVAPTVPTDSTLGDPNLYAVPITLTLVGTDEQVFAVVKALQTSKQLFLVSGVSFGGEDARTISGFIFITREQPLIDQPIDGSTVN